MSDTFWNAVFAAGIAQGVFLTLVLLVRRATNRCATRLLAALVGLFTAMILGGAMTQVLRDPFRELVIFLNINLELAIGPLMFLVARSIFDPARRLVRRDTVHLLPMALGVIVWITAWAVLGEVDRRHDFLDSPVVPIYVLLKAIWLYLYVVATFRSLKIDPRVLRLDAPGLRSPELSWLRRWMAILAGMAGLIYATHFAGRLGIQLPIDSDPLGSLILTLSIYLITLMVMQRPWIFALRPRSNGTTQWAAEAARLTSYLERERPWLEPELGLGDLAGALGSTTNRLSTVIREGLDTTYYALLNTYRLAEFERLARKPGFRERSVLDLAFQAGFNSKASFYRAFRERHGTTPTAFRNAS